MNGDQEVLVRLSVNNINRILNILAQGRYDQVYDLISSIRDQSVSQLSQPAPNFNPIQQEIGFPLTEESVAN